MSNHERESSRSPNRDAALDRAWQQASDEQPSPRLDAAIIAAARKSVQDRDEQARDSPCRLPVPELAHAVATAGRRGGGRRSCFRARAIAAARARCRAVDADGRTGTGSGHDGRRCHAARPHARRPTRRRRQIPLRWLAPTRRSLRQPVRAAKAAVPAPDTTVPSPAASQAASLNGAPPPTSATVPRQMAHTPCAQRRPNNGTLRRRRWPLELHRLKWPQRQCRRAGKLSLRH